MNGRGDGLPGGSVRSAATTFAIELTVQGRPIRYDFLRSIGVRAAAAPTKRPGTIDSDVLEVTGWIDIVMLRRCTATVETGLTQAAQVACIPADAQRFRLKAGMVRVGM